MCGIAGYIGVKRPSDERVSSCLSRMNHRGPDASGVYRSELSHDRHICLLHSRLNIIDLDPRANQPFTLGHSTLTYNGEIYNYLELRETLESAGKIFTTNSDTEVLLHALSYWGTQHALARCEGMWSFAFYDQSTCKLTLSRDRFGEKPLYFYQSCDGVYFASEPRFIFSLLGHNLKPNMNHLYRHIINGYRSLYKQSETYFEGLQEVPKSSYMTIDLEGSKIFRYWSPTYSRVEGMTYSDAVDMTRDCIINSVKLRLRADVPIAFCMSGGIDSNTLISISKNVLNYDVHGFTVVNTDVRYEEQDIVDAAVAQQGIQHTSVNLTTDNFLQRLRHLVSSRCAPVLTISYYAHWLLMEEIHNHGYKISVSGTGADELFTGYYEHHSLYLAAVHHDKERYASALKDWQAHIQPIVRNPYLQDPEGFIKNPTERRHLYLGADEFRTWFRHDWNESYFEEQYTDELLRNRMLNDLFHDTVPPILHEDDSNAMYYSIENRSPFLDSTLCEVANSIPSHHLVQNGLAKAVLRDSMKGIVPDFVLNSKRKVGFNAPIESFLDITDNLVVNEVLADSPIFEHICRDRIEALMNKQSLLNSESKFLFYFLNAKMFLEEFLG